MTDFNQAFKNVVIKAGNKSVTAADLENVVQGQCSS